MNNIEIVTPRLKIRVARMEDAAAITAAKQEVWGELQKWMSWAHDGNETLESTQHYIANVSKDMKTGNIPLIGLCRDTDKFVVTTGLFLNGDEAESGYWVAKEFLGKGYATEACNATMRYGFDVLKLKAVTINYFEGNDKSRRIIEKLGFTKIGMQEKVQTRCSDGALLDKHFYIMRDASVLPELEVSY